MKKYSTGVFLNLFSDDVEDWKKQVNEINNLVNVNHIEILLESLPKKQKDIRLLKSLIKKYKIIIHAPFMDLSLLSPHNEIVKASVTILHEAIQIGHELSAELMTIHSGKYANFWDAEKAKKETINIVKRILKYSTFPISIENLSISGNTQLAYPQNPDQIKDLADLLPKNAGITIDTGHLLKDEYSVYNTVRSIKDKVMNFHLHDGYKGSAHLKLGDGEIKLEKFIALLDEIKYNHFVTLEVVGRQQIRDSWKLLQQHTSDI